MPQRVAQNVNVLREGYRAPRTSFHKIGGNEVGCTRHVCASILHGARLTLTLGLMKPAQPARHPHMKLVGWAGLIKPNINPHHISHLQRLLRRENALVARVAAFTGSDVGLVG